MKLQPRHFIAALFLAVSGFMVVSLFQALGRVMHKDWTHIVFLVAMSSVMILVPGVPGILALKRRWEDFVKFVAFIVLFMVSGLLSRKTIELNTTLETYFSPHDSLLYPLLGLCLVIAPFVLCIAAYKRLVPLILRRIARAEAQT